ncbi:hypothetical protein NIES2135_09290 [Leptolyngbya boryana NIES-2135]|jgi:hypothetical protein|uniref:Uncharacterized protein n=1 Tax=Leptolyngbya boryana NIES-2135 TaxID=1973484 RepID=A0A1Z4JBE8_LEPBY|nr:hypothetical protein NIES2135_09290 [Leptolyngbya boryana NIES-2135]
MSVELIQHKDPTRFWVSLNRMCDVIGKVEFGAGRTD